MKDLEKIYKRRFSDGIHFRDEMYKIICRNFFQKYIPYNSTVLDLAAGYCEFINNINASVKIAVDINPDVKNFATKGIKVILSPSTDMREINDKSIDIVFTSNFFEHLIKEDIVKTVKEMHRILKNNGKVLILQPNIRYCYRDYWMFFDHVSPLDDRSMCEVLEINGFKIIKCIAKFLPYSTKSKLPKSIFLLKLYLEIPLLQRIFGRQAFIYAEKTRD